MRTSLLCSAANAAIYNISTGGFRRETHRLASSSCLRGCHSVPHLLGVSAWRGLGEGYFAIPQMVGAGRRGIGASSRDRGAWDSGAGSRKRGSASRGHHLSHISDPHARDHDAGGFADAGWRSDHLGALRDRFLMAHLAGLVCSALLVDRTKPSRPNPRMMAGPTMRRRAEADLGHAREQVARPQSPASDLFLWRLLRGPELMCPLATVVIGTIVTSTF